MTGISKNIEKELIKAMMFQQWENNSDIKAKTETRDYKGIFDKITVSAGKGFLDSLTNTT